MCCKSLNKTDLHTVDFYWSAIGTTYSGEVKLPVKVTGHYSIIGGHCIYLRPNL